MGLNRGSAHLLLREHFTLPFQGSVLQLGRQHLAFTEADFRTWAHAEGVRLLDLPIASSPGLGKMDDVQFFKLLGFAHVHSCDVSAYQNADIVADLNEPVPSEQWGRYDTILDGGTMEHVFHVPNVLRNLHVMLKEGGRIIHIAPTSNQIDHGFYCFSPTFFHDYYRANSYELRVLILFACLDWNEPWSLYAYAPKALEVMKHKMEIDKIVGCFVVARKQVQSTCHVVPQQGFYKELWAPSGSAGACGQPVAATLPYLGTV